MLPSLIPWILLEVVMNILRFYPIICESKRIDTSGAAVIVNDN